MLQNNDIKPRLATRFLIKAGGQKQKGQSTYPEKWNHFKVCSPDRDEIGNPTPQNDWMMENLGTNTPTEVPFMFFTNDPTQCYDDGYAYRTRTQRLCYSNDGITAYWSKTKREGQKDAKNPLPDGIQQVDKEETEDSLIVRCPGHQCPMQQSNKCKINLRLTGFIPRPESEFKFQGADVFYSSSYNSAAQLRGSLQTLIMLTGGNIAFVPLTLKLQPKKAIVGGKQIEVYIVSFFPEESVDKLNARTLEGGMGTPDLALAPPQVDFDENITTDEYYPEPEDRPSYEDMSPGPVDDDEPPMDVYDGATEEPEYEDESVPPSQDSLSSQRADLRQAIKMLGKGMGKSDNVINMALKSCEVDGDLKESVKNYKDMYTGWQKLADEEPGLPGMD